MRAACTLVDTTCGSVLNVWKNVTRYARDGFTSVIHGKYWHEETRATASQALEIVPGGHYLVVLDKTEARDRSATTSVTRPRPSRHGARRFSSAVRPRRRRPASIPTCDLQRVGCANQTTMLSTESLEVGEMFRQAMRERYGEAELASAVPSVRHDLQRDAGSAGRGRPAAARRSRST